MKFEIKIKDIQLTISIEKDPSFKAVNPETHYNEEDLQDLEDNLVENYSVFIESRRENMSMTHYQAGILLSTDPAEVGDELNEVLNEHDLLQHVIATWKVHDCDDGPQWKKS